jgi:hypothetical protein
MAAEKVVIMVRQAILKRAFEGKLVSQNSGDEPTSVQMEKTREVEKMQIGRTPKQARLF